jgi:hypothetical protein
MYFSNYLNISYVNSNVVALVFSVFWVSYITLTGMLKMYESKKLKITKNIILKNIIFYFCFTAFVYFIISSLYWLIFKVFNAVNFVEIIAFSIILIFIVTLFQVLIKTIFAIYLKRSLTSKKDIIKFFILRTKIMFLYLLVGINIK